MKKKQYVINCVHCDTKVKPSTILREGVELKGLQCPKCKEEYYTSSELFKFDIKTGRRKNIRKFGTVGDSTVMRIPKNILSSFDIKPGDYGIFEKRDEGILIKPIKASEMS